MTCHDCLNAASIWHWGGIRTGCEGCAVRAVAICPPLIRQAEYKLCAPEGREEFVEQVNAERRRIRELRAAA
jgi:hypothetical protein